MTQGMRTDTALMVKTEKDVDGVADRLTSLLTGLMNELTPLQSAWVGSGGSSFQAVRDRFDGDMGRLNAALRSIAEAVGSSGRDYSVSDEEMQSEMDRAGASAGSITQALKLN
jgi:WXG100 family type VII secretion target